MLRPLELTGQTFGRLTVLGRVRNNVHSKSRWLCQCTCGNKVFVDGKDLKREHTSSCGCFQKEMTANRSLKHGHTRGYKPTKTYRAWQGMHKRCENEKAINYAYYGGRGIKVCERWDSFENFLADMGKSPSGLTLDRIDNDRNYEPGNCRWATWEVQANNKRKEHFWRRNSQS